MKANLLFLAAVTAALSTTAAKAQDATGVQGSSAPQAATWPTSTDASSYGDRRTQSASGSITEAAGKQPGCVGPASFCNIYKGGQ